VTDAEEEVRSALRLVMERLAGDTPLHRMAVLYPTAQPYALLAHEQFSAAGVPHNGPAVRTLAQTLTGRTLLGLLRLRETDFRRDALMDWLSAAPVLERAGGGHAPAQRWDALSRSAGVVGGASQWRERLARHRRSLEEKRAALERMDEGSEWQLRRLGADLGHLERLARFIDELTMTVDPGSRASWTEFGFWARGLLERYLGGEGHRRDWPEEEIEAHRAVEGALEALSNLGDVRPRTDEATFRRALERELEAPAGRIGRFGEGVFVGHVRDAMGTEFDVVFVLGMTEGVMPPRGRDDPLLPDRERSAAGDDLPLRTNRPAEERRDYLAALAAAPERVLLFPRADLRGQRGKLPARWLLETASQLEGRNLFSTDLGTLRRPWFTAVPSFESALAGGGEPASEQEYHLRSLLRWRRTGAPVTEHYLLAETPTLRAGLSADLERGGARLTRWDGRLQATPELAPSAERPVSPTALQDWATCPFRYFLGHVLRVAETEKPEDTLTLSPLERGNLLHRALETFIREMPQRTAPDQPWSPEERARLAEIARQLCDEAEGAGVTGKPLLWRLERERLLRDLAGFLDADEEMRAEQGVVPEAVELSFGVAGADQPALIVPLGDGRAVAFRGRIDRVDRAPDGSRLVVLDYKSGSANPYRKLDRDPVKRGQVLQLPVYALAAAQAYGDVPAAGYYWFVTERWNYDHEGYDVDEGRLARFRDAVAIIVSGIERGVFPARPGERTYDGFENCGFCPYDRVCPRDRSRVWRRKRGAQELRDYLDLAEPEG
jgi:RecB family exonuclease